MAGGGGKSCAGGNSRLSDPSSASDTMPREHRRRHPLETCPVLASKAARRKGGSFASALARGRWLSLMAAQRDATHPACHSRILARTICSTACARCFPPWRGAARSSLETKKIRARDVREGRATNCSKPSVSSDVHSVRSGFGIKDIVVHGAEQTSSIDGNETSTGTSAGRPAGASGWLSSVYCRCGCGVSSVRMSWWVVSAEEVRRRFAADDRLVDLCTAARGKTELELIYSGSGRGPQANMFTSFSILWSREVHSSRHCGVEKNEKIITRKNNYTQ